MEFIIYGKYWTVRFKNIWMPSEILAIQSLMEACGYEIYNYKLSVRDAAEVDTMSVFLYEMWTQEV